jgi:hypothetical protein
VLTLELDNSDKLSVEKCYWRYQFLGKRFMLKVFFGVWLVWAKVVETANDRTTKHRKIGKFYFETNGA